MGRKIGFGLLAVFAGYMAILFLIVAPGSTGDDGVTLLSGILMALLYGAVAVFSVLIVLGKRDPSNIRWGWGFLAFICGNLAAIGIGSVSTPGGLQNLLVGIVFAALTILFIKKAGGSVRILPESRKYNPGDPLPITACPGLFLEKDEIGHLCEKVQIGKVKNVSTGSVTTHSGGSVRVARGLSVHSGTSYTTTKRADVLDKSAGTLYVTNKRIIGASPKYSFNQKHSSLTSVKMYTDGFALQFGSKSYTILTSDPVYVSVILQIANRMNVR